MKTLAERVSELLPCMYEDADVGSRACDEDSSFGLCERCIARPAILTLLRTLLREERERCAEVALRRVAPDSPDHVAADCTECHDGLMLARDIRALEDRND